METLNQLQNILFLFWGLGGICIVIFLIRKVRNNEPDISKYYRLISQLDDQMEEDLNIIQKRNKEIDKIEKEILNCKKELGLELFKNNSSNTSSIKRKNIVSYILLFIGLIPFVFVLCYGIKNAIIGYSGFCLTECSLDYGFSAFLDTITLFSYLFWPVYLVGVVLIIIGIFKLIYNKKMNKYKDLL